MSSKSARDRKILEQLVKDIILYNLDEKESLEYIKTRAVGIPFSRSYFYKLKQGISASESNELQKRIDEHVRVGLALKYFRFIDQLEAVQKILFKSLVEESSRPVAERNLTGMARISSSIDGNLGMLRVLVLDGPIIQSIKKQIDEGREIKKLYGQKLAPEVVTEYVESALIIPPNTIAGRPIEPPKNQIGDDPNAVFE